MISPNMHVGHLEMKILLQNMKRRLLSKQVKEYKEKEDELLEYKEQYNEMNKKYEVSLKLSSPRGQ